MASCLKREEIHPLQDAQTEIKRLPVWQPLAGRQLPAQNWGKPQSRTSGTPAWGGSSWSPRSPHPGFLHRVAPKAAKITTYSAKLKQISGHNLTLPQFAPPAPRSNPHPHPTPRGSSGRPLSHVSPTISSFLRHTGGGVWWGQPRFISRNKAEPYQRASGQQ